MSLLHLLFPLCILLVLSSIGNKFFLLLLDDIICFWNQSTKKEKPTKAATNLHLLSTIIILIHLLGDAFSKIFEIGMKDDRVASRIP